MAVLGTVSGVYSWTMFISFFTRSEAMYNVQLWLGVTIFSLYCIADTQMMIQRVMSGKAGILQRFNRVRYVRGCYEAVYRCRESVCQGVDDSLEFTKEGSAKGESTRSNGIVC